MAKGNDGNYLQHSLEVATAVQLAAIDSQGRLHMALTHGMAPFEPCDGGRRGQTRALLENALNRSYGPKESSEPPIVAAYRTSGATLKRYPNSAELLRASVGADRLRGGITEVDALKCCKLDVAWAGSNLRLANASWRAEVAPGRSLSCPEGLDTPWLFALDPMTYREDGDADDNNVYRADLGRLSQAFNAYVQSGKPGAALLFVYAVKPEVRPLFWRFADDLAACTQLPLICWWLVHQGGNRNLAAMLCSHFEFAAHLTPTGLNIGKA